MTILKALIKARKQGQLLSKHQSSHLARSVQEIKLLKQLIVQN